MILDNQDTMLNPLEKLYTFEYDSNLDCAIIIWNGHVTGEDYRRVNELFLEFIRDYDFKKMIRDDRRQGTIEPEDQQWFIDVVVPQLLEAGLRYAAVVVPTSYLAKLVVVDIVTRLNLQNVDVQFFANIDVAKEWIGSV